MKRRGASEVVTTIIIILVALSAAGLVWLTINKVLSDQSKQIALEQFTTNLEIKEVKINESGVSVRIKRPGGNENLIGVRFIYFDGVNSVVIDRNTTLKALEEEEFIFLLYEFEGVDFYNLKTISVAPIVKTKEGEELIGIDVETYDVSGSSGGGGWGGGGGSGDGGGEPQPESCSQCGDGLLNICDRDECQNLSEGCYFLDNLLFNECNSCSGAACTDYSDDQQSCTDNVCKIDSCGWNSSADSCEIQTWILELTLGEKPVFIEPVGGTPNIDSGEMIPFGVNNPFTIETYDLDDPVENATARKHMSEIADIGINVISDNFGRAYYPNGIRKFSGHEKKIKTYITEHGNYYWAVFHPQSTKCFIGDIDVETHLVIQDSIDLANANKCLPNSAEGFDEFRTWVNELLDLFHKPEYNNAYEKLAYVQIGNEQDPEYAKPDGINNPADPNYFYHNAYARVIEEAYPIIKAKSNATVVIGTPGGFSVAIDGFYRPTLQYLYNGGNKRCGGTGCFDAFDYHSFGGYETYDIRKVNRLGQQVNKSVGYFREFLDSEGFTDKKLVIQQGGTFTGKDDFTRKYVSYYQTEQDQSEYLFKRMVFNAEGGMIQNQFCTLIENFCWDDTIHGQFTLMSLMYNGIPIDTERPSCDKVENVDGEYTIPNCDEQLPCPDPGFGVKKTSYFTYKFLIDKLDGVDWDNIQKIYEENNVYVFKFLKQDQPFYVAWWDWWNDCPNAASCVNTCTSIHVGDYGDMDECVNDCNTACITANQPTIQIDLVGIVGQAQITEAIPNETVGLYLNSADYPNFFNSYITELNVNKATVQEWFLNLTLAKKPFFIEPLGTETCGSQGGIPCSQEEVCSGTWLPSSDVDICCFGSCVAANENLVLTKKNFGTASWRNYDDPAIFYDQNTQISKMVDVGMGIERVSATYSPLWKRVQTSKGGPWEFKQYDSVFENLTLNDITIMLNFKPWNQWDLDDCYPAGGKPKYPCNELAYLDYVNKVIERYDGDVDYGCTLSSPDCYNSGDNEYPDWAVSSQPSVKYWQLGNELHNSNAWDDTAYNYYLVLNITYYTMKAACPDCKMLIGGEGSGGSTATTYEMDTFYIDLLQQMPEQSFDIIDNHMYNNVGFYKKYNDRLLQYDSIISSKGFNVEYWTTEMGTTSGQATATLPHQTEEEQASELIKRYVEPLHLGVKAVMWNKILENHKYSGNYCNQYCFTGLIQNPLGADDTDCADDVSLGNSGQGYEKLSYYSYKFLIDKISGSDYNIEKVNVDNEVYLYKFNNSGKPVYLVWWDWFDDVGASKEVIINMTGFPTNRTKITEAIPYYVDGSSINPLAYPNFFNSYTEDLISSQA